MRHAGLSICGDVSVDRPHTLYNLGLSRGGEGREICGKLVGNRYALLSDGSIAYYNYGLCIVGAYSLGFDGNLEISAHICLRQRYRLERSIACALLPYLRVRILPPPMREFSADMTAPQSAILCMDFSEKRAVPEPSERRAIMELYSVLFI